MYKELFSIAIPLGLQSLFVNLNEFVDTFMISILGEQFLGGVNAANAIISFMKRALLGVCAANAMLTGQFNGVKNMKGISRTLIINIGLSLIASTIFVIIFFFNQEALLIKFAKEESLIQIAREFLSVGVFSVFVYSFIFPIVISIKSRGKSMLAFVGSSSILFVNAFLNYTLLFGNFGFNPMGARGAAIATLLSEAFALVALSIFAKLINFKIMDKFRDAIAVKSRDLTKYLKLGAPVLISNIMWGVFLSTVHIFLVSLGAVTQAGILKVFEFATTFVFSGFSTAIVVIGGRELAKSNFEEAYDKTKKIIKITLILSIFFSAFIYIFAPMIAKNLVKNSSTENLTISMIRILAIFIPFRVFNGLGLNGFLRSGGDSSFIFVIVIITAWFITFPAMYLATALGADALTLYFVINFVEVITAIIILIRFTSKQWIRNLIEGECK